MNSLKPGKMALKIKEQYPDAVLMFITAPNAREIKNRLVGRGTESMEVIEARLNRANEESKGIENYDYLVVNDILDDTVALVDRLIQNERDGRSFANEEQRVLNHMNFINEMRVELKDFAEGE